MSPVKFKISYSEDRNMIHRNYLNWVFSSKIAHVLLQNYPLETIKNNSFQQGRNCKKNSHLSPEKNNFVSIFSCFRNIYNWEKIFRRTTLAMWFHVADTCCLSLARCVPSEGEMRTTIRHWNEVSLSESRFSSESLVIGSDDNVSFLEIDKTCSGWRKTPKTFRSRSLPVFLLHLLLDNFFRRREKIVTNITINCNLVPHTLLLCCLRRKKVSSVAPKLSLRTAIRGVTSGEKKVESFMYNLHYCRCGGSCVTTFK